MILFADFLPVQLLYITILCRLHSNHKSTNWRSLGDTKPSASGLLLKQQIISSSFQKAWQRTFQRAEWLKWPNRNLSFLHIFVYCGKNRPDAVWINSQMHSRPFSFRNIALILDAKYGEMSFISYVTGNKSPERRSHMNSCA